MPDSSEAQEPSKTGSNEPGKAVTGPEAGSSAPEAGKEPKKKGRKLYRAPAERKRELLRQRHIKNAVALELAGEMPESPFAAITHPRKRAFLRAYAETGQIGIAATCAGISRATIRTPTWRDDPLFQQGMKDAEALACFILEDEVTRRGVEGVEKPTGWYQGEPGGYVREYSDNLLMFASKGRMREKYGDKLDIRAAVANLDYGQLSDAQIEQMLAGKNAAQVLSAQPAALALPTGGPTAQPVEDVDDDEAEG